MAAKSWPLERRNKSRKWWDHTQASFSRIFWGAHAPRVPFSAPRRKQPERARNTQMETKKTKYTYALRKSRSTRRRVEHARRVRSPERMARSRFTAHANTI